jgi:hypothetical protein
MKFHDNYRYSQIGGTSPRHNAKDLCWYDGAGADPAQKGDDRMIRMASSNWPS